MKLDIRTDFTKFPRAVSVLAAGRSGNDRALRQCSACS